MADEISASDVNSIVEASDSVEQPEVPHALAERRAVPRIAIAMDCEVVLIDQPNRPTTRTILKDISTRGACFDTSHPFRDNELLMMVMPFINRTGRLILGRVRYCKKLTDTLHQAGVEFLDAMNLPRSQGPVRIPPKWLMPRFDKKP